MKDHRLEVADVFRDCEESFLNAYGNCTNSEQRKVLKDVVACRTVALGGHVRKCEKCGHRDISYNSCRNRHCPKCQGTARARWLSARMKDLLDVDYFHVIFTIPDAIGSVALQNKRVVYGILFRAISETLIELARDRKNLGAQIGFLAVLHTWGQTLNYHPHVHCVVPGGGIGSNGDRWLSCKKNFFLPVRVMGKLFRGKFVSALKQARRRKKLKFHGKLKDLSTSGRWRRFIKKQLRSKWVVYSKPPFGGPERVLKYLARYTHRVAISNHRLLSFENGKVTLRIKDYANNNSFRRVNFSGVEFIRRYLQHVFPKGFMHVRQYGFLANRVRAKRLDQCRRLLLMEPETKSSAQESTSEKTSVD